MSDRLPAALRAYRMFSVAITPLTPLFLARRLRHGKEHGVRLPERRGVSGAARPLGPLVWLHGASVGELISVLPLIERIHAREVNLLVTSGTVTSSGLAEQRLPRGVIHQFVPIDVPFFVRRFLNHWQPDLALFVESELWPNIMIETSRRGVPMILVNGRLSENSFRRWRYLPASIGDLLGRLDLCHGAHAGRRRTIERIRRAARRHHRRSQTRRTGAACRPRQAGGFATYNQRPPADRGGLDP